MIKIIIILSFCFWTNFCFAQKNPFRLKADTLLNKVLSTKYILDSTNRCLTAIDSSEKQLWQFDLQDVDRLLTRNSTDININCAIAQDHITNIVLGDNAIALQTFNRCSVILETKNGVFHLQGCD